MKSDSMDHNFCRNPDKDEVGPWCYISLTSTQYCPVPICGVSEKKNRIYIQNPRASFVRTQLWDIAQIVKHVCEPACLLVGTVLNAASVALFTHQELRESTTALMLIILAIFDTAYIYWTPLFRWLRLISGWQFWFHNDLTYSIWYYVAAVWNNTASWIIVLVTGERVIAITRPFEAKVICTKKNAKIASAFMLFFISLVNVPVFFGRALQFKIVFEGDNINFVVEREENWCCIMLSVLLQFIVILIDKFIPFVFMIMGNIIISVCLFRAHRERQKMSNAADKSDSDATKAYSLTLSLLCVSFWYLILSIPYVTFIIVAPYTSSFYNTIGRG